MERQNTRLAAVARVAGVPLIRYYWRVAAHVPASMVGLVSAPTSLQYRCCCCRRHRRRRHHHHPDTFMQYIGGQGDSFAVLRRAGDCTHMLTVPATFYLVFAPMAHHMRRLRQKVGDNENVPLEIAGWVSDGAARVCVPSLDVNGWRQRKMRETCKKNDTDSGSCIKTVGCAEPRECARDGGYEIVLPQYTHYSHFNPYHIALDVFWVLDLKLSVGPAINVTFVDPRGYLSGDKYAMQTLVKLAFGAAGVHISPRPQCAKCIRINCRIQAHPAFKMYDAVRFVREITAAFCEAVPPLEKNGSPVVIQRSQGDRVGWVLNTCPGYLTAAPPTTPNN